MSTALEDISATSTAIAHKAPHWAALLLLVGLFLFYMDHSTDASIRLSDQRMAYCQSIQGETTQVIKELNSTLKQLEITNAFVIRELSELRKEVTED